MVVPLITIGITCYNAEDTVSRAIDSALSQNWDNYEILVVDDCSTDDTIKTLERIKLKTPYLRLLKQSVNQGVSAARNRILEEAKGEFIAFFDDDDISVPSRLSKQYERLVRYEECFSQGSPVLCHTARRQHYLNGKETIASTVGCKTGCVTPNGSQILQRLLTGRPCSDGYGAMATCSQMARKSVYLGLGGFDETLRRSEDTDLTIRHAQSGGHFVGIGDPLVKQTMTMTNDKGLNQELECTLQYMGKHRDLFPSLRSYEFHRCWVQGKYDYFKGNKKSLLCCFLKHPALSVQKTLWALPSYYNNKIFKSFYGGKT